ncbi:tRNA (adenosine(37)-N6)-threonylcarbamoyltransferase complex dimerization subunit type 1 TsaB [Candidatus Aerophobetes bacterium]|uniref:tRNA (Adenosine(37)-N6)-threonylcarbamoyltransferase complex dimerization subunit type 1 TsaB n=1 Tax=Aerophobetes bacterium TaxID=2030807 RepID=A0A2A4YEB6_UNCAE|nr:MAG: tRNA (adenosine(37)-N6)-threonylcarbamoyltransferase complex dimerization subunit type 1 TsaB [Candidatus Aerophobetes bacterium]
MKSLCIESSRQEPTLVIFDHSTQKVFAIKNLKSSELKDGKKHSTTLILEIKNLLEQANILKKDLDFIGTGLGPGSFIGTRVGIVTAKTLAYALEIPIVYYCSLELYDSNQEGSFVILSDAKSKGLYAHFGKKEGSTITFDKEPSLYTPDELLKKITKNTLLISPEADIAQGKLPSALSLKVEQRSIDFALWEKNVCKKTFLNPLVASKASEPYTLRVS